MMDEIDLHQLEERMLYEFKDKSCLEEACRHSSFVNEQGVFEMRDNERLEFLGDAVLNLVVGHILMIRFPEFEEGELTRTRAGLVNESRLAEIARGIDIGPHIRLGKGEFQTNGREKNSILANTLEAVIAAVYLDGGYEAAYRIMEALFSPVIDSINKPDANLDYKSKLQELVQTDRESMPVYRVIRESGPDHDKTFRIKLDVCGLQAEGTAKSKKMAEQEAAKNVLERLTEGRQ